MHRASSGLQLELPLAATSGDQLALPPIDSPFSHRLKLSARDSIRVSAGNGVLEVSAPCGTDLLAIEAALRDRCVCSPPSIHISPMPRVWGEGMQIPFLGRKVILRLTGTAQTRLVGTLLELALPPNASPVQIRDAAHGWLQTQAQYAIGELVATRTRIPRWALSYSRNTLTAVDANGCLRLNWRLVLLSRDIIAQVLDQACARDTRRSVQTELLSE
jgi:predicted metal-dependent hydrolase